MVTQWKIVSVFAAVTPWKIASVSAVITPWKIVSVSVAAMPWRIVSVSAVAMPWKIAPAIVAAMPWKIAPTFVMDGQSLIVMRIVVVLYLSTNVVCVAAQEKFTNVVVTISRKVNVTAMAMS